MAWLLAALKLLLPLAVLLASRGADAQLQDYLLGPGDRVNIIVFGHTDLSAQATVGANGAIALPLLGQVQAAALTASELEQLVIEKLDKDFVVDPKVAIEVLNYRPFFILGEVKKPGKYDYIVGITVRKAIALAEGFTRRGKEDPILLIREDREGTPVRYRANLDTLVHPGDTIEVLRRLF